MRRTISTKLVNISGHPTPLPCTLVTLRGQVFVIPKRQRMNTFIEQIMVDAISHMGPALAADPEFLKNAVKQLPPAPYGMLEVRLESGASQVDFSQGFRERDYSLIAPWLRQSGDLHWSTLGSFVNAISAKDSLLNSSISGVGLEFDLDCNAISSTQLPNLFFIFRRDNTKNRATLLTALKTGLATLFAQGSCKALLHNCTSLLNNLPSETQIRTAGVMLARAPRSLRLQLEGVPPDEIPKLLKKMRLNKLPYQLDTMLNAAQNINLPSFSCVDLAPHLLPQIGLEFKDIGSRAPEVLSKTLDLLVHYQLCCPEKRDNLNNWTGCTTPTSAPIDWITNQTNQPPLAGNRYFVTICRRISHIKLMASEDQGLTAKAYLEVHPEIKTLS